MDFPSAASCRSITRSSTRDPGVQSGRRLIEEQDGRIVDQGAGQAEPLLLPAGQDTGGLVREVAQAHAVQHVGNPLRNSGLGQPVEASHLREDLAGCQGLPHAQGVRHPADPPAHFRPVVLRIKPFHRDSAGIRCQQRGQHQQQRGLAGAVGPDQGGDLTRRSMEIHVLDGVHLPEAAAHRRWR